jgi:hypothetical protein
MGVRTVGVLTGFFFGLSVTCVVSAMFGKWRLWAATFAAMWFVLIIQSLILRQAIKRQSRAMEWVAQAIPVLEQAVADYEQAVADYDQVVRDHAPRRKPDAATRDEIRRLGDEIAQVRREG